jgi:hypothetical protein
MLEPNRHVPIFVMDSGCGRYEYRCSERRRQESAPSSRPSKISPSHVLLCEILIEYTGQCRLGCKVMYVLAVADNRANDHAVECCAKEVELCA